LDCGEEFVVTIAVRVELAAVHGLVSVDADAVLDRLAQREAERAAADETQEGIEVDSAVEPDNGGAEPLAGRTTAGESSGEGKERTDAGLAATTGGVQPSDGADVRSASAAEQPGSAPSREGAGSATG